MVTCEHMNQLLRLVLRLIMYHVGVENAPWMTRIAGYTQQIIINSSEELLRDPYYPLADRVHKRAEYMFSKEENLRSFLKSTTEDTSQVSLSPSHLSTHKLATGLWFPIIQFYLMFYELILMECVLLCSCRWRVSCRRSGSC